MTAKSRVECTDPASEIIQAVRKCMATIFSPTSDCPPLGGGTTKVWFFAGDAAPINEVDCNNPFLWVRLASRHRSSQFPDPEMMFSPCGTPEVITVEVGVARCALMDEATFDEYQDEAAISLDDSWRLNKLPCCVSGELNNEHSVGYEAITPYGPEGGIIAWVTTLYISV